MSVEHNPGQELAALQELMAEQTAMSPEDQQYIDELRAEFGAVGVEAQLSAVEVADRNAEAERRQKDALAIGRYINVGGQPVLAADNWNFGGTSNPDPVRNY